MKNIIIHLEVTDSLGLKSVTITKNETEIPSTSRFLKSIAKAILKALKEDKADIAVQDLLNELGIRREK